MGKEMKQILKPELVLIGEVEGRVVGFALALPDVNQALKPAQGWVLLNPIVKWFLASAAVTFLINWDITLGWGVRFLAHAASLSGPLVETLLGYHPPEWLRVASLCQLGILAILAAMGTGLAKILYHQRLIKRVRVLALGVVEEYRASGLAAGFYATLVRNARKLGYGDCEMSWILEDNVLMNRSLEVMGAKRYKTYRIYEWN
jgi:hypothetical protein